MSRFMTTDRFHVHLERELYPRHKKAIEIHNTKYYITQERDLSYRFDLHQHPYVKKLVQRLLTGGTRGLQAADTDYKANNASLPRSIEIALSALANVQVPAGSRVTVVADAQAANAANVPVELKSGIEIRTAADLQGALPQGANVTLMAAMDATPADGAVFPVTADSRAFLIGDATITLAAGAAITLQDGTAATLSAATDVTLPDSARVTVPNATQVTLIRSKRRPTLFDDFFTAAYQPAEDLVRLPYPVKDLDFSSGGAYAVYNWELFFHVPFTIAVNLSKNQRFAEAQHWFHYLFDPTDDSDGQTPQRFWKVRPFQYTDVKKIEQVLVNLVSNADPTLRTETIASINAWKDSPFRPHVIARYRQQAYMYKTVMAYLDNLIAWGDSLFRQDTGEAIDEAMMLYVLAANILGPRPQPVPKKGTVRPQNYKNLREDIKAFGSKLADIEPDLAFDLMPFPAEGSPDNDRLATLRSLGKSLYFCVPRNEKLLSYWDTAADRLFKIRNSLNFQGVFRQLALFEPPIDPALLARAAAAGLDLGAVISGLNQPLPLVRFQMLVQKAAEIAQEVKSLGNNLLSAMEKEEGEALAVLRARHERVVLEMAEEVRYGQLQEAIKTTQGLLRSLALAVQRYTFYELQLGKKADEIQKSMPQLDELDKESLLKMKFKMDEPEMPLRPVEVDIASDVLGQAAQVLAGGKLLSSNEARESILLEAAQIATDIANVLNVASSIASIVPQFEMAAEFWGVGAASTFGGANVAAGISATANGTRMIADRANFEARRASRIDSFARRERDWAHQSNLAAGEISQIFKQLRAAQIREAIAELELRNHRQQIKHAQEIEHFLNEEGTDKKGKKTNRALYAWMKREVKGLYARCFQFAFDVARKAERALRHEIGNDELSYLDYGYLGGKEGLLAGEKLYLDLKRMEMAFHDLNQREYELTKHVSLQQVDPWALIELRATGRCTLKLPESLFDFDGPGHYFRRIKSVAVTIPCATGPYVSVNCALTLLKSSTRKNASLRNGAYPREDAEDDRFSDYYGSLQAVVTSSAQNDSGTFETNLRDERVLPFEYSGVISEWQLQLPADPSKGEPSQFDYNTITDVVLHIRYTAREGGTLLRDGALANLKSLIAASAAAGSTRLFSIRHEFPSEWARMQAQPAVPNQRFELSLRLRPEHYPFWSRGNLEAVKRVDIVARSTASPVPASISVFDKTGAGAKQENLMKDRALGDLLIGKLSGDQGIPLPASPTSELKLYFEDRAIHDLYLAVAWGK